MNKADNLYKPELFEKKKKAKKKARENSSRSIAVQQRYFKTVKKKKNADQKIVATDDHWPNKQINYCQTKIWYYQYYLTAKRILSFRDQLSFFFSCFTCTSIIRRIRLNTKKNIAVPNFIISRLQICPTDVFSVLFRWHWKFCKTKIRKLFLYFHNKTIRP